MRPAKAGNRSLCSVATLQKKAADLQLKNGNDREIELLAVGRGKPLAAVRIHGCRACAFARSLA
jgi:hypothetical protein